MGSLGDISPYEARDAAGFVEAMRRLKDRSGLTYRELEERAARNGDVLARSTLADVLRRTSLPRPDVLTAFVRACGDGRRVSAWSAARERIAAADPAAPAAAPGHEASGWGPAPEVQGPEVPGREMPGPAPGPGPQSPEADTTVPTGGGPRAGEAGTARGAATAGGAMPAIPTGTDAPTDPGTSAGPGGRAGQHPSVEVADAAVRPGAGGAAAWRSLRTRGRTVALVTALVVPLLALGAWRMLGGGSDGSVSPRTPPDGWVTLRPVRTPDLCLTDGRDRAGAYPNAVAVQRPCAEAAVPRVYLEPAGTGLYRIQWHHPVEGKGCLTVLRTGPVAGMLEPRNDCGQATLFRVEAGSGGRAKGFRFLPNAGRGCLGIAGGDTVEGAEAVDEPCTGAADQRFLVTAE